MNKTRGILWAVPVADFPAALRHPVPAHRHITLQYNIVKEDWAEWLGHEFMASFTGECWNERVQALTVSMPESVPFGLEIPHMTLSHQHGVSPAESTKTIKNFGEPEPYRALVNMRIRFHQFRFPPKNSTVETI